MSVDTNAEELLIALQRRITTLTAALEKFTVMSNWRKVAFAAPLPVGKDADPITVNWAWNSWRDPMEFAREALQGEAP